MPIAFDVDVLHRGFMITTRDEILMENINEIHFVINIDNMRTFGFKDDSAMFYVKMMSE